jgi:hypothetical protein
VANAVHLAIAKVPPRDMMTQYRRCLALGIGIARRLYPWTVADSPSVTTWTDIQP